MKQRVILLGLIVCLLSAMSVGEAAFVKYIDRNGKDHYVNTDYTKVPEEYLYQVRNQINATNQSSSDTTDNSSDQNATIPLPEPDDGEDTSLQAVEVFISANCKDCERLETLLQANKIEYMHYDVGSTSMGQEFYKTMGSTPLPITRIGDKIIRGNDINTIKKVLDTSQK